MHRINVVPVALSFVCGVVVGALLSLRRKENKGDGSTNQKEMMQVIIRFKRFPNTSDF